MIIYFVKLFSGEKEKTRTRENNKLEFFSNYPFWVYIKKISKFTFGAWPLLLFFRNWCTPSEGPKKAL